MFRGTALALMLAGCVGPARFVCERDAQCVLDGLEGVCEPTRDCSYPDVSCETSGRRYHAHSAPARAETCVPEPATLCAQLDDAPRSEECNGRDDDCDGTLDDEPCGRCTTHTRDGRRFEICFEGAMWSEAMEVCRARGLALVTVRDAAENDWIMERLVDAANDRDWWLGLADPDADGAYGWTSGDSNFTAWRDPPEPGRCGMFDDITEFNRNWWDAPCDRVADGYVCATE